LVRVGDHREDVSRGRYALEAENLNRDRGTGGLDRLAPLIVERAHPAGELAADEVVSTGKGAPLHQNRGQWPLARIERRLEHNTVALSRRIGLEVEDFSLEQNLLQEMLDPGALLGRDLRREHGTA